MPHRLADVADSPAFVGTAWPSLLLDRRGRVRAVNEALLALVDRHVDDLLGLEVGTALWASAAGGEQAGAGALRAGVAAVVASGRPHGLPQLPVILPATHPGGPDRHRVWSVELLPVLDSQDGLVGVWQHAEDVTRAAALLGTRTAGGPPSPWQRAEVAALVGQAVRSEGERLSLLADNRRLAAALAAMVGVRQQAAGTAGTAVRRRELWSMIVRRVCGPRHPHWADAVAQVAVDALPVVAASAVTVGADAMRHLVAASDAWAGHLHAIEDTVGEGPGIGAAVAGSPVTAATPEEVAARWPGFRQAVGDSGLTGAAGFPLAGATGVVGAVVLYHRNGRSLSPTAQRDALLLADLAATVVLNDLDGFEQSLDAGDVPAHPATGARWGAGGGLAASAAGPWAGGHAASAGWELGAAGADPTHTATQIGRAVGLVAAELGLPIDQALSVLRARAFAEGRLLGVLADDVVTRRVRFRDDVGDRGG